MRCDHGYVLARSFSHPQVFVAPSFAVATLWAIGAGIELPGVVPRLNGWVGWGCRDHGGGVILFWSLLLRNVASDFNAHAVKMRKEVQQRLDHANFKFSEKTATQLHCHPDHCMHASHGRGLRRRTRGGRLFCQCRRRSYHETLAPSVTCASSYIRMRPLNRCTFNRMLGVPHPAMMHPPGQATTTDE